MKHLLKVIVIAVAFLSLSFINTEKKDIIVVIDAGHGGHDYGAKHNDLLEKELVSAISHKIAEINKDKNIKVYFTRTTDDYLELQKRVTIINDIKPDLAISLHVNSNKIAAINGFEAFVSDKSIAYEKSNELALQLLSSLEKNIPLQNKGLKKAPFMVLKKSEVPAITLELGYISNENDRSFITSEKGQTVIAQSILDFVGTIKN